MPFRSVALPFLGLISSLASAQDAKVEFEYGSFWQSRNTSAIPADSTKFSYRDLLGRGPFPFTRTTITLNPNAASGYRLVWAPLRITGRGELDRTVSFDGETFAPGVSTDGEYMFNNYRFTWWKRWRSSGRTRAKAGYTLFVRDARVSLEQGATEASFYNLGFVPLAYVAAEHDFSPRVVGEFEFDGFLSPYGGAIDTGVALGYRTDDKSTVKLRFRVLDGGTSRGSAYSFATFISTSLSYERRW